MDECNIATFFKVVFEVLGPSPPQPPSGEGRRGGGGGGGARQAFRSLGLSWVDSRRFERGSQIQLQQLKQLQFI